ncbi:MAG: 30S ribosomal protein S16 [Simkaniaceae bacterium]|nr:30S ribosomal protein S16 [Simkaniaceae bacterium]
MLKIRLRKQGRTNRMTFRLVLINALAPRDGKYLEMLGHYDPSAKDDAGSKVEGERIAYWLSKGAQLSERAEALVRRLAPEALKQ